MPSLLTIGEMPSFSVSWLSILQINSLSFSHWAVLSCVISPLSGFCSLTPAHTAKSIFNQFTIPLINYIYNNFIKLDFIIQQYVSVLLDIFYMILYNKSLAFQQRQLALKLLYSINNRR